MRISRAPAVVLAVLAAATAVKTQIHGRDMASAIIAIIATNQTCDGCKFAPHTKKILEILKTAAQQGDGTMIDGLIELCVTLGADAKDVCEGSISREGAALAQALRGMTIGSDSSQVFCTTIMGLCSYPHSTAKKLDFPSARPDKARPWASGKKPIKIVHISDIHVDQDYVAGASANCSKPICCRNYENGTAEGGKLSVPAGPNGDHRCDSPVTLEESMYRAIGRLVPDAAFTISTGDVVDRAVWLTTQSHNTEAIMDAYGRMLKSSEALGPVYAATGNHEIHPVNLFPPTDLDPNGTTRWVYDTLSRSWNSWLEDEAATQADKYGAFSAAVPSKTVGNGKLRIISVNTNLYYTDNFFLYEEPLQADPSGQFAWLIDELDRAEKAGERVYIIGHIPIGVSDMMRDASNYFDQIVNRYDATIAAMFFGHTHQDQFQISYSNYSAQSGKTAVAVSYIAPSMVPDVGMPAFRVYDVDPVTFAVLDATTYLTDMTDPGFQAADGPSWEKYYSAREAYRPLVKDTCSELSPAFWHNVTMALATNQTAFDEYFARKTRGYGVKNCTGTCLTLEICGMQAARVENNCRQPTFGIHFSKRNEDGLSGHGNGQDHAHADGGCGIGVMRRTFAALAGNSAGLKVLSRRLEEQTAFLGS